MASRGNVGGKASSTGAKGGEGGRVESWGPRQGQRQGTETLACGKAKGTEAMLAERDMLVDK